MQAHLPKQAAKRVRITHVNFDVLTEAETTALILSHQAAGQGGTVVTVNLDHLLRCARSDEYRQIVARADLVVADGQPIIWASRLQRTPLPERVAGSTLCLSLAQELANAGRSLFLLGGDPGVAEQAASVLIKRFPGLKIAGTHCPAMGFEHDPQQMDHIRQSLRQAQPDVVYVALGSPKQERLIEQLKLELPAAWWLGVGISLSFITGDVRRAPLWAQRSGLEWVHRLWQEPRRLGRRYLIDGLPFAAKLLIGSAWRGATTRPRHADHDA